MSTQAARPAERGYHQDYIARIRYENALPPPPGAPKLLNIPIEGLNYYTSAAFASRMARQQPLNIEADAELGMPIDLVGMPGIFDGDESSIQAPLAIPPMHPKDKTLLRPLSELGKPKFTAGGHSFLRRTEYISSDAKARAEANASAAKSSSKSPAQQSLRKQTDSSKEDPMNILRHVIKGFDLANPGDIYHGPDTTTQFRGAAPTSVETEAWNHPKHPTKPDVKLLDSYPVLPDLEALTDSGAYMIMKFNGNPTNFTTSHDVRMDVAIVHPVEQASGEYSYELHLPKDSETVTSIKRKFEESDVGQDEATTNTHENKDGVSAFRYHHYRTYDLGRQANSLDQTYKEVALALHDDESEGYKSYVAANGKAKHAGMEKGAYYYPIASKMQFKSKRNKNLAHMGLGGQVADEAAMERPEDMDVVIRNPNEEESIQREKHRSELVSGLVEANGA